MLNFDRSSRRYKLQSMASNAAAAKKLEAKIEEKLREISRRPENKRCMDCLEKGPRYVVLNFNIFVCSTCSGIHREFQHRALGVSMSKFTLDQVKALDKGGNKVGRKLWLAKWNPKDFPEPESSDKSQIREFIKRKYVEKAWYKKKKSKKSKGSDDKGEPQEEELSKEERRARRRASKKAAKAAAREASGSIEEFGSLIIGGGDSKPAAPQSSSSPADDLFSFDFNAAPAPAPPQQQNNGFGNGASNGNDMPYHIRYLVPPHYRYM